MPDDDPILWQLLLQVFLICLNAVFACAEIAVISISDTKLEKYSAEGNKRAGRLLSLTKHPAKFLATIQVGITLAGFLGSAFAADNFSDKLVSWLVSLGAAVPAETLDAISIVFITIILSYFTLILGELVPKRIAMQKAEKIGLAMSGFIFAVSKIFAPLVFILTASTNGLLRLLGIDPHASDEEITEEEIRMMVDAGSEKGAIDSEEREIINNLFDFDNKTAEEIMTHRTDVELLWLDESDGQWAEKINGSFYSHYPICGDSADDITGVLSVKSYFRLDKRDRAEVMRSAVKPPQFVPESVMADVLFRNMKKSRSHFAVVLDEYGGMSGVITMNDLLEQLVGDIDDGPAENRCGPAIEKTDSDTWRVSGAASLDELEKALCVTLPAERYDTFAAFVFGLLGTIPDDGATPELITPELSIKVTEIREHRLEYALVSLNRANIGDMAVK